MHVCTQTLSCLQHACRLPGVRTTTFDMCQFGLKSKVAQTPMRKRTTLLHNMAPIDQVFGRKLCVGLHKHGNIQGQEARVQEWVGRERGAGGACARRLYVMGGGLVEGALVESGPWVSAPLDSDRCPVSNLGPASVTQCNGPGVQLGASCPTTSSVGQACFSVPEFIFLAPPFHRTPTSPQNKKKKQNRHRNTTM